MKTSFAYHSFMAGASVAQIDENWWSFDLVLVLGMCCGVDMICNTWCQLHKSVRCTKGFDVSVRRGECLVHGVFPWSGAPEVASGRRDSDRSGDSTVSVERTGFHPSSRAARASMLPHVCAQDLDEPECKIAKSGAQWPHFADSRACPGSG